VRAVRVDMLAGHRPKAQRPGRKDRFRRWSLAVAWRSIADLPYSVGLAATEHGVVHAEIFTKADCASLMEPRWCRPAYR
jgi:hypothetical protein